ENTSLDAEGNYGIDATVEVAFLTSNGERFGRALYAGADTPFEDSPLSNRVHVFLELGDHLGSTAAVIDHDTSEVVERRTHHPYGAIEADYRPDRWGSFRETYGHSSHVDLAQVGLVDFGLRYYSPVIGRWLSADPLAVHGLGGDPNPYAFTAGSPMGL